MVNIVYADTGSEEESSKRHAAASQALEATQKASLNAGASAEELERDIEGRLCRSTDCHGIHEHSARF